MTGPHTICTLFCKKCQKIVGWKYVVLELLLIFLIDKSIRGWLKVQGGEIHSWESLSSEGELGTLIPDKLVW
jgi:hypothetical protein